MLIRRARVEDVPQMVRLFYETIHQVNSRDYTPEQINAWAPKIPDEIRWAERLSTHIVFVAESEETQQSLGFGELEADGHIDCFYIHHAHQGCGVGRTIYQQLETEAKSRYLTRLFVEVSITARPFFERQGFHYLKTNQIIRNNVTLTNFSMEKRL